MEPNTIDTKILLNINSKVINVEENANNIILNMTESNITDSGAIINCEILNFKYNLVVLTISIIALLFSTLFCLFGYRCFKAILFLTGFIFSFAIIYLICQEEDLLTVYGNIGISLLSGFLYGLICLLVPYVGFFTLGFLNGVLVGFVAIISFQVMQSIWITIGFLLGIGLFVAVSNICYPSLTVLTTSLIGSTGIVIAIDYLLENYRMLNSIFNYIKNKEDVQLCVFNWFLLTVWLIIFVLSSFIQYYLTANGFSIKNYPYQEHPSKRPGLSREDRINIKQTKYRYLYQIRTSGGDILSQSYIKSLQNKSQLNTLSTHMSTL